MPNNLHVVINPRSRYCTDEGRARIERTLKTNGYEPVVHVTTGPDDAEAYAAALSSDDIVAVVGGDGTICEAGRGAVRSGAALLPLPGGRGNDFCRYFDIPLDLFAAVQAIPTFAERTIDVASVNGKVFVGVATLGFDSIAADNANKSWLKGSIVYALGAIQALARWKPLTFKLSVDGKPRELTGWSVILGNTGRYGGGMIICPGAEVDDGQLELLTISEGSKFSFAKTLPKVFTGDHLSHPSVAMERVRSVTIESIDGGAASHRSRMAMFADGDPIGEVPCDITVMPQALRVVVPRKA